MILLNVILGFLIIVNIMSAIFQLFMGNYSIPALNVIAIFILIIGQLRLNKII